MYNSEIFVDRLLGLCAEKQLGLMRLARELNTTKATVSRYCGGRRAPTVEMLVAIADYFGVTTDYLLGLERESSHTVFVKRPPFSERLAFLLRRYGLTVYRLEKETRINEETVYGWQKGEHEPRTDSLMRLAKYLRCSTDFVLGRV